MTHASSFRPAFALLALSWAASASAAPLPLIVEVDNSLGIEAGDSVHSAGKEIGRVTDVGFGRQDKVDVRLSIDEDHADLVREGSTFVIFENLDGSRAVEHYVVRDGTRPAKPNTRFQGARSLAEVWLRRGRINSEELGVAMTKGVEVLRRSIDELKRSEEWPKFKDQVARLGAQLTAVQGRMSKLIEDELPKIQSELDSIYLEYQKELAKERSKDESSAEESEKP